MCQRGEEGLSIIVVVSLVPYTLLYRVVSISGALRAHPTAVALRFIQRRILMSDPNWLDGHYYGKAFPKVGMQNARYAHTHTHMHTHMHAHTHTCTHAHTHADTHTHTHTHAHNTCTHTRRHTHTHTRRHTHTTTGSTCKKQYHHSNIQVIGF